MSGVVDWRVLRKAVEQEGTPFYLFERPRLIHAMRHAEEALASWGPSILAYSVKTNPLASILLELSQAGHCADVASVAEFGIAIAAGFPPERIVFNGPLKAKGIPIDALSSRLINVDTLEELDRLEHLARSVNASLPVGLRVCSPLTAPSWSRFGLNVEAGEMEEATRIVRGSRYLRLSGLQLHLGTQVEDVTAYLRASRFLHDLWVDLSLAAEDFLDVGGGFFFSHDGLGPQESMAEAMRVIGSVWKESRPILVVEPGRIIAAPALSIVSTVIAIKQRPREPLIIVLDTGTNHNISAAFFQHDVSYELFEGPPLAQRLVGPLCMEDDILSGEFEAPLPTLQSLCIMRNAGAYSLTFARSFIQDQPPVLELQDEEVRMLRTGFPLSEAFPASTPECVS